MASRLDIQGRTVWLKHYAGGGHGRRVVHGLLNLVVGALGVDCLRAPPHHAGDAARDVEFRRIGQLRDAGVRVPEVLGRGKASLMLADTGPSLSRLLRHARGDQARIDALVGRALDAIAAAHRRHAYFGQAFARNMTVGEGDAIGFIDFEEDPGEVMSLVDAQARDWLMFSVGVGRHYDGREAVLAGMLAERLRDLPEVGSRLAHVVARLEFVERVCYRLGRRSRAYGVALRALRGAVV